MSLPEERLYEIIAMVTKILEDELHSEEFEFAIDKCHKAVSELPLNSPLEFVLAGGVVEK